MTHLCIHHSQTMLPPGCSRPMTEYGRGIMPAWCVTPGQLWLRASPMIWLKFFQNCSVVWRSSYTIFPFFLSQMSNLQHNLKGLPAFSCRLPLPRLFFFFLQTFTPIDLLRSNLVLASASQETQTDPPPEHIGKYFSKKKSEIKILGSEVCMYLYICLCIYLTFYWYNINLKSSHIITKQLRNFTNWAHPWSQHSD